MEENIFKEKLLYYLNDKEIIRQIKKINNKTMVRTARITNFKISSLSEINKNSINLKAENEKLIEQNRIYEEKIIELNKTVNNICGFGEDREVFNTFINLSEETKKTLRGIFKEDTFQSFIACGCQIDNLETFWECIKYRIQSGNLEELAELQEIIYYLIEVYNKTLSKPLYKLQEVLIEEEFDTEKHTREYSNKTSGVVREILLNGYYNINSGKIVKKAMVRVD